ncbi:MAG: hypothetical protein WD069_18030 [Planctomycetales bacterium]
MESFYTYCAVIAGTLLVGQFVLNLVGLAHDGDVDPFSGGHGEADLANSGADGGHDVPHDGFDHSGQWFVGMLSFRALVAGATVFGLAGVAAGSRGFDPPQTFLIALAAGGGMLYLMAWLMRTLYRLRSDGTVRLERAIGQVGTVYLSIPAEKSGAGKVTLAIQGRTMEFPATTAGEALPSGTAVVVRALVAPGVIEVAKAETQATVEESHV